MSRHIECPKCEWGSVNVTYFAGDEEPCLSCDCNRCGYGWSEPCSDAVKEKCLGDTDDKI